MCVRPLLVAADEEERHAGTRWDTLGHAGTRWDTLGHAGTRWDTPARQGTYCNGRAMHLGQKRTSHTPATCCSRSRPVEPTVEPTVGPRSEPPALCRVSLSRAPSTSPARSGKKSNVMPGRPEGRSGTEQKESAITRGDHEVAARAKRKRRNARLLAALAKKEGNRSCRCCAEEEG